MIWGYPISGEGPYVYVCIYNKVWRINFPVMELDIAFKWMPIMIIMCGLVCLMHWIYSTIEQQNECVLCCFWNFVRYDDIKKHAMFTSKRRSRLRFCKRKSNASQCFSINGPCLWISLDNSIDYPDLTLPLLRFYGAMGRSGHPMPQNMGRIWCGLKIPIYIYVISWL